MTRPARVVLVVHEFPRPSETFIVQKFLGLLHRGIDVQLFAGRIDPDAWRLFPGLADPAVRRRVRGWPKTGGLPTRAAAGAGWLIRAVLRRPLAVVRAFAREVGTFGVGGIGRAAFALPLIDLDPDLVHFEFGTEAAHRADLELVTDARLTASFRGFDLNFHGLDRADTYDSVWRILDGVHVLGEDLKRRAVARGLPRSMPVWVIPPALEASRYVPAARDGAATDGDIGGGERTRSLHLLSVGRLHWKKGYEFALHAVRALVDAGLRVEYRIAGAGEFEPAVRACITDLELDHVVTLLGHIEHRTVSEQLVWADVLVHAAVSEGFCNAVLEAQAMGVPVVCTDADGLQENVLHEVTGVVVPRRDPEAMAHAIRRLADDPELGQRMGSAGRERVETHFSESEQIGRFIAFFGEMLGRPIRAETA